MHTRYFDDPANQRYLVLTDQGLRLRMGAPREAVRAFRLLLGDAMPVIKNNDETRGRILSFAAARRRRYG
jgi:hypothetical protein